ncbi:efflux RND transporter permease subunit [Cytophaga hutchinsonii]|jgi:HAE1 family hydrophobic/amphiphilic exporter-1|uniref:Acridine efflux pump n=1 Tax=Cytophaga hutchinsonii (strain ATCC 33406 / DSM 1761 / CIP 103989 / NBRC 15051 / NCIMB 9469 / D465) TaxID=269798 RepID=A0A6N4SUV3_CYTH3|nr:efflux RND transporter permease subunit [Cytophaga hutchinsonii]ABG60108.1 acridine efflux pump [Cytophaga hutchinsonii ATCC 33406]SFX24006.1 hydrophobic/amphiphilic exporter-1, HAE1 family [Cytophaga hutchinsonii ATCC 33406]
MFQQFIRRPALAIVISLVIMFMGLLAIKTLPKSQFPDIAPPMIVVYASYPGASSTVLTNSVLIPLEQAINGVPGMKYMFTTGASSGEANLQIVFNLGTDPNQALVNVQNRIEQMKMRLPPLVQLEGIVVQRLMPNMLMYVNVYGRDTSKVDMKYIFNYTYINMLSELQRVEGVGLARILGSRQYSMRIWLNPDRMRAYNISSDEVMKALDEQSIIGSPGRIGRADSKASEAIEYVLTYPGRYDKESQYNDVIIRATPEGEVLRLKDVATVELGSEYYDIYSNKDEFPSAAITINQAAGSNATEVIENLKVKLEELKKSFPPGIEYEINYDVSTFLDASTEEVVHTLRDAFILVSIVVFIFLGDWRSTIIPVLAVPVSLIGAFFMMQLFGLNINLITLFALVLAIGIVVDDAIVVVEAVHAKMEEKHCSPYIAVKEVLGEISGAIIAITLLMTSVFVPVAFMTGPVGIFFRQFAITMASSIVISGVVALTLTPVLCAMILKNTHGQPRKKTMLNRFIDSFNRVFEKLTGKYVGLLRVIANRKTVTFGLLITFSVLTFGITRILPSGFVPSEDQGMIYAVLQTPPGSTLERTYEVSRQLQEACKKVHGVQSVSALAGYEILTQGRGSNSGTLLINLTPWNERHHTVVEITEELEELTKDIPGAKIEFFGPPAVPGYGAAGGIGLQLLDKNTDIDYERLDGVSKQFMKDLEKRKELTALFTFYRTDYPQYELEIDNKLAMQKGVSIKTAMDNISIMIGSTYDIGFIKFGRFFKVFVQADPSFRRIPTDILKLYVKNDKGEQVPYSSFMSIKKTQGIYEINRYNMYTTSSIRCSPAAGYSSGEAIEAIKEVAAETLPKGYDIDWSGLQKDEVGRGNEAVYIFLIVLVFVYLVLAAQYESFILPMVVILSLPAGIFGAFLLIKTAGMANDIYGQVALVMLVGLLGKNAVLIVEYAVMKNNEGLSVLESAIEGAKARFRPILMTSFAFIAGLIPLIFAHGPGAIGNKTIGAASLGGMLFGTVFGVIIVPGLYYIFGSIAEGRKMIKDEDFDPLSEDKNHHV